MKKVSQPINIACFISPHGFGHAARAAAVMESLYQQDRAIGFDIYTSVPQWFFADSLSGPFAYHFLVTDVGLVQETPMQANLSSTVEQLDVMLPFDRTLVHSLAEKVLGNHCRLILCDIAPLGIEVARAAGIPSVLIENFTWDWIYQGYVEKYHRLKPHIDYLQAVFAGVDHHIQTEPVCRPAQSGITTKPVSRRHHKPAAEIRKRLDIPLNAPLAMLTLGGIPPASEQFRKLSTSADFYMIIPGGGDTYRIKDNIRLLPHHSGVYHPDLVNASDVVIGKLGYSTLAEVFQTGVPFGYFPRFDFRESAVQKAFIEENMVGLDLSEAELLEGAWVDRVPDLLAMPKKPQQRINGAEQAAEYILDILD
jgi:hypothetical protein